MARIVYLDTLKILSWHKTFDNNCYLNLRTWEFQSVILGDNQHTAGQSSSTTM